MYSQGDARDNVGCDWREDQKGLERPALVVGAREQEGALGGVDVSREEGH